MGMAASQARLLTITARLADNELRSQTINNAKMRLATQSSQVSENYINALNDATLKFSNYDAAGNEVSQALTFNALTAYSSYNTQYGLVNSSGQILVSESEAKMFEAANGNLNAYLKSHGLEYTTTYFDELGNLENEAYPAPFNLISSDEMKLYYEQYNSYENSIEVENYEKNYGEYVSATKDLQNGAKSAITSYLQGTSAQSPKLTIDATNGDVTIDLDSSIHDPQGLLEAFENAFKGNNTYSVENLAAADKGFISETVRDQILAELNNYGTWDDKVLPGSGDTTVTSGIIYRQEASYFESEVAADGTKTYVVDDMEITVDANGYVTGITGAETDTETESDGSSTTTTYTHPAADGTVLLKDFIDGLSYCTSNADSSGTTSKSYTQYETVTDSSGNITGVTAGAILTEEAAVREELNGLAGLIVSYIQSMANYEVFADWILAQDRTQLANQYGINPDAPIGNTGYTLNDYLNAYTTAKDNFLENIFSEDALVVEDSNGNAQYVYDVGSTAPWDFVYTPPTSSSSPLSSKDIVEQDLKNGYSFKNDLGETVVVTAENLTDIDFVLQYLKERRLTQSDSFNTIIKEYLVDNMIEVYGEPKYAWVDENDTSNTGNADAKAQWYTNLFNRMMKGYKALESGLASSSEWIEYALESGIVSMEQVDKSYNWDGLDYKTCTKITEETSNDAVTKAEAEYNRAMNDIEAKDNIYDIELKNIDTEHSSLQTEYDSIKSVISKNIERTFKFNQSA